MLQRRERDLLRHAPNIRNARGAQRGWPRKKTEEVEQAGAGLVSVFVLLAIAAYATSLAPVTWVLISEIFPNKVRGLATSVAVVSLWAAYFVLAFTFPILAKKLGTYGPFWLYAGICLLGFFFIRSKVKETKGKTLEELETFIAH